MSHLFLVTILSFPFNSILFSFLNRKLFVDCGRLIAKEYLDEKEENFRKLAPRPRENIPISTACVYLVDPLLSLFVCIFGRKRNLSKEEIFQRVGQEEKKEIQQQDDSTFSKVLLFERNSSWKKKRFPPFSVSFPLPCFFFFFLV